MKDEGLIDPDYKLSFGGRRTIELGKQGYKISGKCKMDNGDKVCAGCGAIVD